MSDPRIYQRAFGAYPSHTQMDALDNELNGSEEERAELAELDELQDAGYDEASERQGDLIATFRAEY